MPFIHRILWYLVQPVVLTGKFWGAWPNLIVWSAAAGVFALWVYKQISPQNLIIDAKNQVARHLLSIRLYQHDLRIVLRSTASVLWHNTRYLLANVLPLLVLLIPMVLIMSGLVVSHAFAGMPQSQPFLVKAYSSDAYNLRMKPGPGNQVVGPPLRSSEGFVAWNLRLNQVGTQHLIFELGDDSLELELEVAQSGVMGPIVALNAEGLLYPHPPVLDGRLLSRLEIDSMLNRQWGVLPEGEMGVVLGFMVISLVFGLALRKQFNVTL